MFRYRQDSFQKQVDNIAKLIKYIYYKINFDGFLYSDLMKRYIIFKFFRFDIIYFSKVTYY